VTVALVANLQWVHAVALSCCLRCYNCDKYSTHRQQHKAAPHVLSFRYHTYMHADQRCCRSLEQQRMTLSV
jgi:hypothetical protein